MSIASVSHRVAAFFDVDGTLVPSPSLEWRFFSSLRRRGAIRATNYLVWLGEALWLLPQGISAVQHGNKRYLRHVKPDQVFQHMESIVFFDQALERVAWHARQQHPIVLVTGTLAPLAQLVALALGCELEARGVECTMTVRATSPEERDGEWTGRTLGPVMTSETKARAIRDLAQERKLDLQQCYAYGNALTDAPMLAAVGRSQVVNPGKEMAAIAHRRNWPVWHWHSSKKISPAGIARVGTKIQHSEGRA